MKGINQFTPTRLLEKRASANASDCVFISYSRRDKDGARIVAAMIKDLGIDIYFDENDKALQLADEMGNHEKVVECIENGIAHSTVLLGIITENTKDSWWVPYEIGSANGRGKLHAHLITKEVERLPSYIKASTILPSLKSLDEWLPNHTRSKLGSTGILLERMNRELRGNYKSASIDPVPMHRSIGDLNFY
jgi:hypothetical protein